MGTTPRDSRATLCPGCRQSASEHKTSASSSFWMRNDVRAFWGGPVAPERAGRARDYRKTCGFIVHFMRLHAHFVLWNSSSSLDENHHSHRRLSLTSRILDHKLCQTRRWNYVPFLFVYFAIHFCIKFSCFEIKPHSFAESATATIEGAWSLSLQEKRFKLYLFCCCNLSSWK